MCAISYMKKLIFHPGFHKTGTTALQQALSEARKELKVSDFNYPNTRGKAHHSAAWAITQELLTVALGRWERRRKSRGNGGERGGGGGGGGEWKGPSGSSNPSSSPSFEGFLPSFVGVTYGGAAVGERLAARLRALQAEEEEEREGARQGEEERQIAPPPPFSLLPPPRRHSRSVEQLLAAWPD